jgi:poly-gamma-glutamate synthesis protein (capsule biosynthesis protein)
VLQGWSRPAGKLVVYSLGNFVFYARNPDPRSTGVLTVTVDPGGTVLDARFDPARIDGRGEPILLEGAERDAALAALDARGIGGPTCP